MGHVEPAARPPGPPPPSSSATSVRGAASVLSAAALVQSLHVAVEPKSRPSSSLPVMVSWLSTSGWLGSGWWLGTPSSFGKSSVSPSSAPVGRSPSSSSLLLAINRPSRSNQGPSPIRSIASTCCRPPLPRRSGTRATSAPRARKALLGDRRAESCPRRGDRRPGLSPRSGDRPRSRPGSPTAPAWRRGWSRRTEFLGRPAAGRRVVVPPLVVAVVVLPPVVAPPPVVAVVLPPVDPVVLPPVAPGCRRSSTTCLSLRRSKRRCPSGAADHVREQRQGEREQHERISACHGLVSLSW